MLYKINHKLSTGWSQLYPSRSGIFS